jgi:hypothetical protein
MNQWELAALIRAVLSVKVERGRKWEEKRVEGRKEGRKEGRAKGKTEGGPERALISGP